MRTREAVHTAAMMLVESGRMYVNSVSAQPPEPRDSFGLRSVPLSTEGAIVKQNYNIFIHRVRNYEFPHLCMLYMYICILLISMPL